MEVGPLRLRFLADVMPVGISRSDKSVVKSMISFSTIDMVSGYIDAENGEMK